MKPSKTIWLLCAGFVVVLLCAPVRAQLSMVAGKAQSHSMPGGFAGLREPGQSEPYYSLINPSLFAFPVWFDTGASGNLISYTVASELDIPTTGETYADVGIGGQELFDVSPLTELLLVPSQKQPTYNDINYALQLNSHESYGNYKLQIRQFDHWFSELLSGYFNVIGTAILNNYVMKVNPNSIVHQFDTPALLSPGPYPMLYVETALLNELPSTLPPSMTIEIPLAYSDYVPGDPPVSVGDNPVIPGVRLADAMSGSVPTVGRDWLLDTGGTVTIISKLVAGDVGIDQNTPWVSNVQVSGVGGGIINLYGYEVDELILPSSNHASVTFADAVVYVVDWNDSADLPAEMPGIFGMNLLHKSIDNVMDGSFIDFLEGVIHPEYLTDSAFREYYVDPFGSQLVLVLDGPIPGDVNGDGWVSEDDLSIIITNWGQSLGRSFGDLNGNGVVDGPDYTEVLSYWGTGSPPEPPSDTPEPATLGLLLIGSLALLRRRR